jgi:hypothetical protein
VHAIFHKNLQLSKKWARRVIIENMRSDHSLDCGGFVAILDIVLIVGESAEGEE